MPDSDVTAAAKRLAAAKARAKRKAMGPPLGSSDADLDALAQVGPADVGEIEAFIRQSAGQLGVDLFNAKADESA